MADETDYGWDLVGDIVEPGSGADTEPNPFGIDNLDAYNYIPTIDWGSQIDWNKVSSLSEYEDSPLLKGLTTTPLGNYFDTTNIFSPANANYDPNYKVNGVTLKELWNQYGKPIKDLWNQYGKPALDNKLAFTGLSALASYLDRQKPSGGGYAKRYTGATPIQRTIVQGKYGPIAQYSAAPGGITGGGSTSGGATSGGSTSGDKTNWTPGTGATNTNTTGVTNPNSFNNDVVEVQERARGGILGVRRYAYGGPVHLEDGGFVLTKKAVDGAGGSGGVRSLLPQAQMIRGPGTGTSDSIKGMIVDSRTGRTTPAAVSNGEAYVPKRTVDQMGGARQLYALMNKLERRG